MLDIPIPQSSAWGQISKRHGPTGTTGAAKQRENIPGQTENWEEGIRATGTPMLGFAPKQ